MLFNATLEEYKNSTSGQDMNDFLGNDEYKWAVSSAVEESLNQILDNTDNTEFAEFVN